MKCGKCGHDAEQYGYVDDDGRYLCDECGDERTMQECRICQACGLPMVDGMTDLCRFYTHEACFEAEMNRLFGDGLWFATEDEGEDGGYYAAYDPYSETYGDTGIFYTEWY